MPRTPKDKKQNGFAHLPGPRRLPPLLRRAWFALNQTFRQRLGPLDLTPDQFTLLRWIVEFDPKHLNQRQLANLMTSDPNTITSILCRMETAGMIARRPHPRDRRAQLVIITSLGREKFDRAHGIALDLQEKVLQSVPAEKRDEFLHHLELIADCCYGILDATREQTNTGAPNAVKPTTD